MSQMPCDQGLRGQYFGQIYIVNVSCESAVFKTDAGRLLPWSIMRMRGGSVITIGRSTSTAARRGAARDKQTHRQSSKLRLLGVEEVGKRQQDVAECPDAMR
jgi:hypothetical protein